MKYWRLLPIHTIIAITAALILTTLECFAATPNTLHPYHGSIQKSFSEPAKTYLQDTYEINMPLSGKLQRIQLREGMPVQKNQIVAQLDQVPWRESLNQAIAKLHTFQAQYELQQKTVKRRTILRHKGYIDAAALDEALAQKKVLLSQIAETEATIAITKYRLEQSTIRSPITGTILNRYSQGGKWQLTGDKLLRIGDLSQLEVICDVLTQEAQQVKIGDPVLLSSIGSPITLHGKVKQIYPAGFTKKSSLGVDEQRVNIIISIKNPK